MGSKLFLWKRLSKFTTDQGNLIVMLRNIKSQRQIDVMKDIDSVPSNVQSSRQEALLFVFEDNEAVIKTCFQDPQSCT